MKQITIILVLILLLFSCENRFPEYKNLGGGVFVKLLSFTDSDAKIGSTNYVKADIKVYDGKQLLYHNFSDNILANNNPFNFLIKNLNQGDSAMFIIDKGKFEKKMGSFNFPQLKSSELYVTIKVHQFYSDLAYEKVKVDEEMLEQLILKRYLAENNISSKYKKNGVYIIQKKEGKGDPIVKGNKVIVNYTANFVNYIEFDNTYNDIAFTFTYGNPDQVIRGLELAIKGMKLDEEIELVIPSQLAFGDEGSSTGVVPPYTTVVYALKIVKIERN